MCGWMGHDYLLAVLFLLLLQLWNTKMQPWSYCVNDVSRELIKDNSVLPVFYGCGFVATLQCLAWGSVRKTKQARAYQDKAYGVKCCLFLGQALIVGKNGQALYMWAFSQVIYGNYHICESSRPCCYGVSCRVWMGSKQDSLAELLAEGTWAIKLCCSLNVQELDKYVGEVTGWG